MKVSDRRSRRKMFDFEDNAENFLLENFSGAIEMI